MCAQVVNGITDRNLKQFRVWLGQRNIGDEHELPALERVDAKDFEVGLEGFAIPELPGLHEITLVANGSSSCSCNLPAPNDLKALQLIGTEHFPGAVARSIVEGTRRCRFEGCPRHIL